MIWRLCHSEAEDGCRQCLDDRKRELVRDILNLTSSGNCRLSFPSAQDPDFMDRQLRRVWLYKCTHADCFPALTSEGRHDSMSQFSSLAPSRCGSGSGLDQAINHGDNSARRLMFSIQCSYFQPSEMKSRDWERGKITLRIINVKMLINLVLL